MAFIPRPAQEAVLAYQGGKMGISAVPGSGKTFILSCLAAQLVNTGLAEDQEVLVVTFSNSAVFNIGRQITALMRQEYGLLPHVGYRVRTLHGLAHDIVRERPALAGLAEDFVILDERITAQMREEAVLLWLREHPFALDYFVSLDVEERSLRRIQRRDWPNLVIDIADKFISRAKDLQLSPGRLRLELGAALAEQTPEQYALLQMGMEIFEDYQRGLSFRGGVDFDDLIRLALDVLMADPGYLERLRYRWPYILEDEAQDSSFLQEKSLRLLSDGGNWVRVGDPNQAINTTFTTANPHFLRQFLKEESVSQHTLPNSGRSTLRIIDLANYLVDWTCEQHPNRWLQNGESAAFLPQHIVPTPPSDPQPNPEDEPENLVHLHTETYESNKELRAVLASLARWLPTHKDWTVAVLVPINARGFKLSEMLRAKGLPYEEMLRSTARTRHAAGVLEAILRYLAHPLGQDHLARAFVAWDELITSPEKALDEAGPHATDAHHRDEDEIPQDKAPPEEQEIYKKRRDAIARLLRRCNYTEEFLFPTPEADWVATLTIGDELNGLLTVFREAVCRWLSASVLPVDQLVLMLAQELFTEPSDLALAYKLALVLRAHATQHPHKRLAELVEELALIARNERRFLGFDEVELGYKPKEGIITVSTMHKAKGLEWDRVYLLGVNNYNFPSAEAHDLYRGESWFIQDRMNLEAESIAQLELLHEKRLGEYALGEATEKARIDYTAERLRLLYVGITRAKKELIITCNSGRGSFEPKVPAAPLIALHTHWEERDL